jgi:myo-inositol 2-dehydrogenase/D-chiro-inositol 1-dehydrogenase
MVHSADSIHTDTPLFFFLERYQEAYLAEMHHFVNCLLEDKEPSAGGWDGKISVLMGLAAQESLTKATFIKVRKS